MAVVIHFFKPTSGLERRHHRLGLVTKKTLGVMVLAVAIVGLLAALVLIQSDTSRPPSKSKSSETSDAPSKEDAKEVGPAIFEMPEDTEGWVPVPTENNHWLGPEGPDGQPSIHAYSEPVFMGKDWGVQQLLTYRTQAYKVTPPPNKDAKSSIVTFNGRKTVLTTYSFGEGANLVYSMEYAWVKDDEIFYVTGNVPHERWEAYEGEMREILASLIPQER